MSEGFPTEGLPGGDIPGRDLPAEDISVEAPPVATDRLLGVVLCGGESRRMGADKGSMLKDGMPWAQYIADKLTPFQLPVVFSISQQQRETYPAFIPAGQLITDNLPIAGPLKGLLSVHERFPSNDLLLLACDMLDLDEATIGKMISVYQENACLFQKEKRTPASERDRGECDFFVYQEGEFAQPFCGIYGSGGLRPVYDLALQGGLRDFGLQSLLNGERTKRIPIDRQEAFGNYNSL